MPRVGGGGGGLHIHVASTLKAIVIIFSNFFYLLFLL